MISAGRAADAFCGRFLSILSPHIHLRTRLEYGLFMFYISPRSIQMKAFSSWDKIGREDHSPSVDKTSGYFSV